MFGSYERNNLDPAIEALQDSLYQHCSETQKIIIKKKKREIEIETENRTMVKKKKRVRGGVHFGGEGLEREEETEHEFVVLVGIEGSERPIPLSVEQANAVPVEYVHHVRVVPARRRHRRRRADLRSPEELHSILASLERERQRSDFGEWTMIWITTSYKARRQSPNM